MNKQQLEYALERLKEVARDKYDDAKKAYTKKGKPFDGPALVEAIKSGKVKVNSHFIGKSIARYDDVSAVFVGWDGLDKPDVLDQEAYNKVAAYIGTEVTRIKDQLILGEAKEALSLIEAFAAKKFP